MMKSQSRASFLVFLGMLALVFVVLPYPSLALPNAHAGMATYEGAPGDILVLNIELDNGVHIEIHKDPTQLIGQQMSSLPSGDSHKEGAEIVACGKKAKCEPLFGSVVIHSLTGDHVTGRMMVLGSSSMDGYGFDARVTSAQNPILTGGAKAIVADDKNTELSPTMTHKTLKFGQPRRGSRRTTHAK